MDENNSIQLFEDRKIRTAWDEEKEEWYFSVVDVIAVLTDQPTARSASTYWAVLKKRLKEEGASELLTNCKQLKMRATDGKMRLTDVASTEQLLRIIQSIPSPKAEPFKRWLAQVGRERIEETIDPEQAIDRALETYQKKGYDADWIHQRILSIRVRNELTAEWQARGVEKGREYAILTDEITKAWSGILVRDLDIGHAGPMLHKLPDGLLAVPELRIILVFFHIRQHLLHGLLQELGGHFTGLHTKRKGFLRDFFLQGVHLRSPLPYRSWLTRDV